MIDYIALFDALFMVRQHVGCPSVTLQGRTAGAALRSWAAHNATDVEVGTGEVVGDTRWTWTVLRVIRPDLQITVILDDDLRVPVVAIASPEPFVVDVEIPF